MTVYPTVLTNPQGGSGYSSPSFVASLNLTNRAVLTVTDTLVVGQPGVKYNVVAGALQLVGHSTSAWDAEILCTSNRVANSIVLGAGGSTNGTLVFSNLTALSVICDENTSILCQSDAANAAQGTPSGWVSVTYQEVFV